MCGCKGRREMKKIKKLHESILPQSVFVSIFVVFGHVNATANKAFDIQKGHAKTHTACEQQ